MTKTKVINAHDKAWIKYMEWGARTGCHQRPDRSFYIHGYQFPVCARCTGVFLGYLLSVPCFLSMGYQRLRNSALAGCMVMFLDWLLQALHIKSSTNSRRFITGAAGGFGLMVLWIGLAVSLASRLRRYAAPA